MANISGAYDQHAEASDFSPIPNGAYRAEIIESEISDISSRENKGRCLKLTWKIVGGEYQGRLIWQRLNMWPENMQNMDKVVTIANSQFAAIRQATGKPAPQDSSELHHIPCEIYVGLSKAQPGYDQQNEIKSVKPGGNGAMQPPPRQQSPQQQRFSPPRQQSPQQQRAPSGDRTAPWRGAQQNRDLDDEIPF